MTRYDNIFLMGDIYVDIYDASLKDVCQLHYLKHLIHVPNCYKNLDNLSVIDLLLTNNCCSFHNSCVVETMVNVWNLKKEPKIISYQNHENYSNEIL